MYDSLIGCRAARAIERTRSSTSSRTSCRAVAMKLIDVTRSTRPCSSTSCSCSKSARSHRSKSPLSASSERQSRCFLRGVFLPEPVERLADRDCVNGAIDERYPLGCAGERRGLRNVLLEGTPHLEHGLDRDQGGTARDE